MRVEPPWVVGEQPHDVAGGNEPGPGILRLVLPYAVSHYFFSSRGRIFIWCEFYVTEKGGERTSANSLLRPILSARSGSHERTRSASALAAILLGWETTILTSGAVAVGSGGLARRSIHGTLLDLPHPVSPIRGNRIESGVVAELWKMRAEE